MKVIYNKTKARNSRMEGCCDGIMEKQSAKIIRYLRLAINEKTGIVLTTSA
jgi:hypothetical protein